MTLNCKRSGVYKPPKTRKKPKLEGTSSKKCDYPFRLHDFFKKYTKDWWLAMLSGIHNHELETKLVGHLLAELKRRRKK